MTFTQILDNPIPRNAVKQNALLSDLAVLKFAQATNYPLTQTQWHEIQRLFSTDLRTTDLMRQSAANLPTILISSLATKGLHFTPWQIATYYTALQTKGFAILSGISGTGKTKLAQHFAEMLPRPSTPPLEIADETISITVQPSMLKYKSLVVPARAVKQFQPPDPTASREVPTTFDGAEHTCRIYRSVSGTTDFVGLYLRGPVGNWFTSNFEVGDRLILDMDIEDGVLKRLYLPYSVA